MPVAYTNNKPSKKAIQRERVVEKTEKVEKVEKPTKSNHASSKKKANKK